MLFTIEAKSGTGTTLQVPFDQIQRCMKWVDTFELYKNRQVILAFKFSSKKRIRTGEYERRQLREFYKVWPKTQAPIDCVCTYEGKTYALEEGKKKKLTLKEHKMPFKSKHIHLSLIHISEPTRPY